ncbi:MAG TPA: hypothetical protein VLJ37_10105 [bacterium]|nr:hypothetical protein [bacterium]
MHTVYKRVLPILLLALLTAACGKKSAPAPASDATANAPAVVTAEAPAPAATSRDGSWEGSSGPDLPISFTVEGDQVTSLSASYAGHQDSCSFNGSVNSEGPAKIDGKSFTAKGKYGDGSVEFTAAGTFTSMSDASGTLVWKGKSGVCGDFNLEYKWTAKKSVE